MKKLLLKIAFLFALFMIIPSQNAMSNIYTDLMGVYNSTGDAETQYGYGFVLGIDFAKDFSFIAKGIITSLEENGGKPNEANYTHKMFMGGFGYGYNIPAYRLVWRSSALIGYSATGAEEAVSYVKSKADDSGVCYEITTGIQWNATQHIAPFLDIGYHTSYYTGDFQDASIGGIQAMLGIRFYMFRVKSIDDDY